MLRTIKNPTDYEQALNELARLAALAPPVGSPDYELLEVLAVLVGDYESHTRETELPDPIDAIRFRMEQANLTQADLAPLIGSRSKVSEVLSRKRPLSLSMIRALHSNLGIPAEVLLQDHPLTGLKESTGLEWNRFPLREMMKLKWIPAQIGRIRGEAEELVREFFQPLGSEPRLLGARFRRGRSVRSERPIDQYIVGAWLARICVLAKRVEVAEPFNPARLTPALMVEVARLSWSQHGPRLAQEFLAAHGVAMVVERHLSRSHLDGAALIFEQRPIVALTLRHDRLDNFWFCLLHELAHLRLHVQEDAVAESVYLDDLDYVPEGDPKEREADEAALEALIPDESWRNSEAAVAPSEAAVRSLAFELGISPAIVAGRVRKTTGSYRILNDLIGQGEVRRQFPEVVWQ